MRRLITTLGFLALASAPASAASGYAYGSDHCYHFDAPSGWVMDNRAAASDGLPMVFYPLGSTWQTATTAIYTRPMTSPVGRSDATRIREQVEQVLKMYHSASENIQAKKVQEVASKSGSSGELWAFTDYSNGGAALVTYFAGRRTVNFFVMQISNAGELQSKTPVLLELATSYRESNECKPCSNAGSCTVPN